MRGFGLISLLFACAMLAYGWFALAWDGGTSRTSLDKIIIALAIVLIASSVAMIAGLSWSWKITLALWVLLGAGMVSGQLITALQHSNTKTALPLYQLPEWSPRPEFKFSTSPRQWAEQRKGDPKWQEAVREFETRIAGALSAEWWQTPVTELRRLRQQNDAIARDWEIQGNSQLRLIVLNDPYLDILDGKSFPLNIFMLIRTASGVRASLVADGFYSDDRNNPVQLIMAGSGDNHQADVVIRGNGRCEVRHLAIDTASGAITTSTGRPELCR